TENPSALDEMVPLTEDLGEDDETQFDETLDGADLESEVIPLSELDNARVDAAAFDASLPEVVNPAQAGEAFGDQLDSQEAAPVPLVKTHDPASVRMQVEMPGKAPQVSFTPPVVAMERWVPRGNEDAWRDVATAIVAEAAHVDAAGRASLLIEAGHVHHRRLGDLVGAEALYRDAESSGLNSVEVYRSLADVALADGRAADAAQALEGAVSVAPDADKGELLREAALIVRGFDQANALTLAQQAADINGDDYAAWSLVRDLLAIDDSATDERIVALEKLGSLSDGWSAAEMHLEAATLLRSKGRVDDAKLQLQLGLEAAPEHGASFLELEGVLVEASDHEGLAGLYTAEAERGDQLDCGWWRLVAARSYQRCDRHDEADTAFGLAVDSGYLLAERERQAAGMKAQNWQVVCDSLEREAASATGDAKAYALYRRGWLLERELHNPDDALVSYQAAVLADPMAAPAADAVGRLLAASGQRGELTALWALRLENAEESAKSAMHFRMAEIAESADDSDTAEHHFAAALDAASEGVAWAAADGLARVLHRKEDWVGLGNLYASRAARCDDVQRKTALLYRAATAGPLNSSEDGAQRLQEVLKLNPLHIGALFAEGIRLEAAGDWEALAKTLDTAADAAEAPIRQAGLRYRAARVRIERGLDTNAARITLQVAVDTDPSFLPALWALRNASIDAEPAAQRSLYLTQASGASNDAEAAWSYYAASLLAEPHNAKSDLRAILDVQADHPGALAAMELMALMERDRSTLADLWDSALVGPGDARQARRALSLAALMRDLGRADDAKQALALLVKIDSDNKPSRAASRVAESIGAWDLAASLLEGLEGREDKLQTSRIIARRSLQTGAALALYRDLLTSFPEDEAVAYGAVIVAGQADDRDLLARAWKRLSETTTSEPLAAAAARWASSVFTAEGKHEETMPSLKKTFELLPSSHMAFRALVRALSDVGDVDGLQSTFKAHRPEDTRALAEALVNADEDAAAVDILRAALVESAEKVHIQLELEQLLTGLEDWQGVYDVLCARRENTRDDNQRTTIDARRRWILAEKLADTDLAWEQYKTLHEESPEDREVTEALARIAGARGDTVLAIQYLKELADTATEPVQAARYQRRVGEVYEVNDDLASARQAYLDALDHLPDDREALTGLRRLAEAESDWTGLVQVLQREVGISDDPRKLQLKREIAITTEEKLTDAAVAMDAWRAVLEVEAQDEEALTHMINLAEASEDWPVLVEMGGILSTILTDDARGEMLCRIGGVCEVHLERDDAIKYYESAIATDKPNLKAAAQLEILYRAKSDWGAAIRSLTVLAGESAEQPDRVEALARAALIELESRHDRESAADFYRRALEIDLHHEPALRFMANYLYETGRYQDALTVCERLEPMVENDQDLDDFDTRMELASFYYTFGEMLRDAGRDDSLQRYERALELNNTHLASLEAAGPLYTASKQWKKAEQIYRQLLQLSGGHGDKQRVASVYSSLGMVERELGNSDKAYKRFNKALELYPNHVGALLGMAVVLEDREDWSNLLNVFNNIIFHATVPEDVIQAYMTKGRILDEQMSLPLKAAQHYQRSLDFDAKQPAAYMRLAELAMRRDAYDEALVSAERGLSLDADSLEGHKALLALCGAAGLKAAGRSEEADAQIVTARDGG
ncbi:MAG: tetratricopeptide repeat protein, partial [Rhodobacterales bacterium]|nr:tetratricopeptide repeat protein [Rhodobacterales bacterium]